MGSRIDDKFEALRGHGFQGSISDMTLQWLQANGATSNHISDAWLEFLNEQGYGPGQRNDLWFDFLGDHGYIGAYPDRVAAFWANGGLPAVCIRCLLDDNMDPLTNPAGDNLTHSFATEDDMLFTDYWPGAFDYTQGPISVTATSTDQDNPENNTNWQTLVSYTFVAVVPGVYEMIVNWEWEDPEKKKGVQYRLETDGTANFLADNSDLEIDHKTMTKVVGINQPVQDDIIVVFEAAETESDSDVTVEDIYISLKKIGDVPP